MRNTHTHTHRNVIRLTEGQLRGMIRKCINEAMNEKVGDVNVISHGEWNDPEVSWEKSHYQKPIYNYWDVEDSLDPEKYPNGVGDISSENWNSEMANAMYDLEPSDYGQPQIFFCWEFENHDRYGADLESDKYFTTKGHALKDAMSKIAHMTGDLTIFLWKNNTYNPVYEVTVNNGALSKDYSSYTYNHESPENAPLGESIKRIVKQSIRESMNRKKNTSTRLRGRQ